MAAVAAAFDPRLASATASRFLRGQRRLQSLPKLRRCARIARNSGDATPPMSPAAAASAAPLAPSTSTNDPAADKDDKAGGGGDDNNTSVLFFAYGALMDPTVMQSRLQGKKAGSSSPRAAVAVAFAEKGGRKEGKTSSSSVAVAFVHRGGWATLVDLRRVRASAASPLWRLVPGSRGEGEEEDRSRGGGWGQTEGGKSDDKEARDSFFASGPCFCSPAHGVLYSLSSESDLEALAEREGGYSLRKVEVRVSSGNSSGGDSGGGGGGDSGGDSDGGSKQALPLEAFAFVSSPGLRLRSPLPPRERYLEKMRRGARQAGLDEGYRAWLERVPSCSAEAGLDGRYQATPAGAVAAAAGVAVFAAVVCLLV